jgi:hypothetical protein
MEQDQDRFLWSERTVQIPHTALLRIWQWRRAERMKYFAIVLYVQRAAFHRVHVVRYTDGVQSHPKHIRATKIINHRRCRRDYVLVFFFFFKELPQSIALRPGEPDDDDNGVVHFFNQRTWKAGAERTATSAVTALSKKNIIYTRIILLLFRILVRTQRSSSAEKILPETIKCIRGRH